MKLFLPVRSDFFPSSFCYYATHHPHPEAFLLVGKATIYKQKLFHLWKCPGGSKPVVYLDLCDVMSCSQGGNQTEASLAQTLPSGMMHLHELLRLLAWARPWQSLEAFLRKRRIPWVFKKKKYFPYCDSFWNAWCSLIFKFVFVWQDLKIECM